MFWFSKREWSSLTFSLKRDINHPVMSHFSDKQPLQGDENCPVPFFILHQFSYKQPLYSINMLWESTTFTHFRPQFPFYTPSKYQNTKGFVSRPYRKELNGVSYLDFWLKEILTNLDSILWLV